MIRRLGHLCFQTDNLPRMADFYAHTLGLPIKITFQNKAGDVFGYYFDVGDSTFIEIFDRVGKNKQWGGELTPLIYGSQYGH